MHHRCTLTLSDPHDKLYLYNTTRLHCDCAAVILANVRSLKRGCQETDVHKKVGAGKQTLTRGRVQANICLLQDGCGEIDIHNERMQGNTHSLEGQGAETDAYYRLQGGCKEPVADETDAQ